MLTCWDLLTAHKHAAIAAQHVCHSSHAEKEEDDFSAYLCRQWLAECAALQCAAGSQELQTTRVITHHAVPVADFLTTHTHTHTHWKFWGKNVKFSLQLNTHATSTVQTQVNYRKERRSYLCRQWLAECVALQCAAGSQAQRPLRHAHQPHAMVQPPGAQPALQQQTHYIFSIEV
jgi:hypothetical protein